MKPHKHAELIKAWADGAEIESKYGCFGWGPTMHPQWLDDHQYRIKPNKRKYRVAEMFVPETQVTYAWVSDNEGQLGGVCGSPHFVRWLTDWIEYDATNPETK